MKKNILLLFILLSFTVFGNENKNQFIKEIDFEKTMVEKVEPYIESIKKSGFFLGEKDKEIYFETFEVDNSKGAIVLVHGFGEYIEKFYELIYYLTKEGYSVYALEHRGHSHSAKLNSNKSQVYVEDYNYYVNDLKKFIDSEVIPKNNKMYLFAHSMGGGIGTLFLERYPDYFEKAILNAPMLQIDLGVAPKFVAKSYSRLNILIGRGDVYAPGEKPYNDIYDFESSSTSSKVRYDYYYKKVLNNPSLQNGGGALKWLNEIIKITEEATNPTNIKKIKTDVLLFQAGNDSYVKPKGQDKLAENSTKVTLIKISNSKHEIYRERDSILHPYLYTVINFYNN